MFPYKTIDQLPIQGKRLLIRVDFNVKIADGQVTDDSRIRASLPTIEYALSQNARVILMSHLGRPKGIVDKSLSLLPVADVLSNFLKKDVIFPEDCVGDAVKKLATELRDNDIMLLENVRFHSEETANDPQFAFKLAQFGDIYINDAFGISHRAHASTVGVAKHFTEKGIGFLMRKEIENLSSLLLKPKHPFLAILGGSKVSDKIGVIENLMNHVDSFLIGGGMAYTFLKAKGFDVGKSLVEESKIHQAEKILSRAESKGVEILLPTDYILAPKIEKNIETRIGIVGKPWGDWMGLDIGPETLKIFAERIQKASTVFWNGPMGVFEVSPFEKGTFEVARMIAQNRCISVVGGGDSLAAVRRSGYQDKFTHLSTGGGASMEFLEGKTLPGLKALET